MARLTRRQFQAWGRKGGKAKSERKAAAARANAMKALEARKRATK